MFHKTVMRRIYETLIFKTGFWHRKSGVKGGLEGGGARVKKRPFFGTADGGAGRNFLASPLKYR